MTRPERIARAAALASQFGGVVHRRDLSRLGITWEQVRTEVQAGRWTALGRHTVIMGPTITSQVAQHWCAVWESGPGAVLDGVAALLASGLTGFTPERIDVNVEVRNRAHPRPGVVLHRRTRHGPRFSSGIPRCRAEPATIRAAQWAVSDRQAALLVAMPVQQRLVNPRRLLAAWSQVHRSPRRTLLSHVIHDVCDGAQSLGELDFARLCRHYHLPEPRRQSVRRGPSGRIYLDADFGTVAVEIDGGQHLLGLSPVDDALRANEITLHGSQVLRIPCWACA